MKVKIQALHSKSKHFSNLEKTQCGVFQCIMESAQLSFLKPSDTWNEPCNCNTDLTGILERCGNHVLTDIKSNDTSQTRQTSRVSTEINGLASNVNNKAAAVCPNMFVMS